MQTQDKIKALAKEKNAVILAHNYQIPEVQDVADYVGDSLGLSQLAARTDAGIIVFCGVHFMAETASILSPNKKVLLPDLEAGCSLADSINLEQIQQWKNEHPDAVVVSYVNTTAEIKAESDYCVTSANAVQVVQAIPADKEILFLPDMFLGGYVQKITGRENFHIWPGECHVHAGIRSENISKARSDNPLAELLIHPECGCTTDYLYDLAYTGGNGKDNTFVFSTSGMVSHVTQSAAEKFLVATEVGILHKMKKDAPGKEFLPVNPEAICEFMKVIDLEKVLWALESEQHEIKVPAEIAEKARLPIERMISVG
jgi:quinolinate synthase